MKYKKDKSSIYIKFKDKQAEHGVLFSLELHAKMIFYSATSFKACALSNKLKINIH